MEHFVLVTSVLVLASHSVLFAAGMVQPRDPARPPAVRRRGPDQQRSVQPQQASGRADRGARLDCTARTALPAPPPLRPFRPLSNDS